MCFPKFSTRNNSARIGIEHRHLESIRSSNFLEKHIEQVEQISILVKDSCFFDTPEFQRLVVSLEDTYYIKLIFPTLLSRERTMSRRDLHSVVQDTVIEKESYIWIIVEDEKCNVSLDNETFWIDDEPFMVNKRKTKQFAVNITNLNKVLQFITARKNAQ